MSRNRRIALLAAIPVGILLLVLAAFGVDRFAHRGQVLRNVSVAGVSLSGLDEDGVVAAVNAIEADLRNTPALFLVNGKQFELLPADIGLRVDEGPILEEAMGVGRGGPLAIGKWYGQFSGDVVIDLPISIDRALVAGVVEEWEDEAIDTPLFDGGLEIQGTTPVALYPSPGLAIDPDDAYGIMLATVSSLTRPIAELPVTIVEPRLTDADIDAALVEANIILGGPVTLDRANPDVSVTFSPADIASILRIEVDADSPERIKLFFDQEAVTALIAPQRQNLEFPPVDAEFRINADETVTLLPGRSGTVVDDELLLESLFESVHRTSRTGVFPFKEGVEPEFTTEAAQAMMPITKVSEFTTNHRSGEPRVVNIQLFADIMDGVIVQPGETLSLNEAVGRRDTARGFVPAPMIAGGELVDSVGGGVSQFATTFYNAVFFGGYEDVEHSPHSLYISRYPEGREATINWTSPDLKFRNDTASIVIIKTSYTSTSITVKFFGNNEGREVSAGLSDRFNFVDPPVEYVGDASKEPGTETVEESGGRGWSVTVTRTIRYPDGTPDKVERWSHRYRPTPRILVVHPCNIPEDEPGYTGQPCPTLIPNVVGMRPTEARAAIEAAGFVFRKGDDIDVSGNPGLDGLVAAQTTGYADQGAAVFVNIGFLPEPPPEEDPPPDP